MARILDEVCELLNGQDASGVYFDGGQVIQSCLREGLIDEMTIGSIRCRTPSQVARL